MILSNDGNFHIVFYIGKGFICLMCDIIIPLRYKLFGGRDD